jgi:hypothetical protein
MTWQTYRTTMQLSFDLSNLYNLQPRTQSPAYWDTGLDTITYGRMGARHSEFNGAVYMTACIIVWAVNVRVFVLQWRTSNSCILTIYLLPPSLPSSRFSILDSRLSVLSQAPSMPSLLNFGQKVEPGLFRDNTPEDASGVRN